MGNRGHASRVPSVQQPQRRIKIGMVVEEEPQTPEFVDFQGAIMVGVANGIAVDKSSVCDGEQGVLDSNNTLQGTVECD